MKKILIINWRDPKSSLEGGAERFTLKFAEHWSQKGNQVFWLTNSFSEMDRNETNKNGVNFIRISPDLDGSIFKYIFFYPTYLLKTILFAKKFIKKENIDIVIDEIHGLPFFTPLYSKTRNILLVCEVAGSIWDKMFPWPINLIGRCFEKLLYKVYEKTEILAISENTKKDINSLLPGKKVKVIDLGIDEHKDILNKIKNVKKTKYLSAIFLARLVKMKGIETALEITAEIVKDIPEFKLFVIGGGDNVYKKYLKEITKELKIENNVYFLGKVSELDKFKYLKQAHFLLHPSHKEGFGLTVLEAGLVGTPSIIRKGSGMDQLVKDGENGFKFSFDGEVKPLIKYFLNEKNYEIMSEKSILFVKSRLWDKVIEKLKL